MSTRLEVILEVVSNILEANLVVGKEAHKKAGGKLPSKEKMEKMKKLAALKKLAAKLGKGDEKPHAED
jgi:hypothetical protein